MNRRSRPRPVALIFALVVAAAASMPSGGFAGASADRQPVPAGNFRPLPATGADLAPTRSIVATRTTLTTESAGQTTRTAKPRTTLAPLPTPTPAPTPASPYQGKNHVWIPALKVDKPVAPFPCSRTTPPGNSIYRWGCAGKNNVYLLAHAATAFKPLHKAYIEGRLRKGMQVIYANSQGKVTTYKVSFWKVVSPVGAEWAYAEQATPSMTLQTCVGPDDKYRLIVRLVKA